MPEARQHILGRIRRSLKRDAVSPAVQAAVLKRLETHPRNRIPARGDVPHPRQIELFTHMASEVAATVERVAAPARVPHVVADYLASHSLPAEVRLAPEARLAALGWDKRPTLSITRGRARDHDLTSVTGAFAGIAETGTLMLLSGPEHPSTLNMMPDTHIVVLYTDQIVGSYEEAWDRLRAQMAASGAGWPRTVLMVTGPSRTGDIEQQIQLGAHGPRRLHIVLVDGGTGGDGVS